ncbi:shikimate kinase [Archaeoglobus veneficus]|uniref:Shikimate kinase n=1 Tax=Archaeoglobus veneficus (strain DSM 11195 / SNP6) TaxID=693661 RepID=F2KRR2_ARCVS|nr:shikimate kinase [Archaeoglobus veneficus]AEA47926.1 shikimate kinase [Archaeoglobus veneficus SNP6]
MKASARAYAAGTVINALATGIGSAFGIELETRVSVSFEEDLKHSVLYLNGVEIDASVVEKALRHFGKAVVEVESEIPRRSGLGSSSAFMNALITAAFKAFNQELDAYKILTANARTSLECGISYTGAFDDASASLLGGLVISNNTRMKLIRWEKISGDVLILIPPWNRGEISLERIRSDVTLIGQAIREAIDGKYCRAMLSNSTHYCSAIGYPTEPVEEAIKLGVCAGLSGNGPTYVAFGSSEDIDELENVWDKYGRVIRTRLSERPAENVKVPDHMFLEFSGLV